MVSSNGKSMATTRVADRDNPNPHTLKNKSMRDFKIYSDLDKVKIRKGGEIGDENCVKIAAKKPPLRNSLPVRKRNVLTDCGDVSEVCGEMSKDKASDKVNGPRKALADVSNIKNNSAKIGVSNGSKPVRTAGKPLIQARKSLPVTKGPAQIDSGDLVKRCNDYSRKSLSKHDSSAIKISGGKALVDVSNLRNNLTSSGGSSSSKTIKIHKGKHLYMPRAPAAQSAVHATASSRHLVMGKSKLLVTGNTIARPTILKKVSSSDFKSIPVTQKIKGPYMDARKMERKSHLVARKSLPVLGRANQAGSKGLEVERGKVKPIKLKTGKNVVSNVNSARKVLWKNRVSDSFIAVKEKSEVSTCLEGVPAGQNMINDVSSSKEPLKVTANKPKMKEKLPTNVTSTNYKRRQSFTSALVLKSEVSKKPCKDTEKEKLPNIDDKLNELDVAEYVEDIYTYYWVMEAQYPFLSNYMTSQTCVTPKMRGILVNWLIEVHLKFRLMPETLFLMVSLFDRFLSVVTIEKNEIQLVGLTALLLASKYEDFWHPKVKDLISISLESYTREQMLKMEKFMLKKLMFRLNIPTSYVFMLRFLKAAQSDSMLENLAFYLIELCLIEYEALKYKPSLLCASAIYVAKCTLRLSPAWTPLLCKHTRYEESELRECGEMILRFHRGSGKGQLRVSHEKYMHPDHKCVAEIKVLSRLP